MTAEPREALLMIGPETAEEKDIATSFARHHYASRAHLPMWVVYDNNTNDFAGFYIVRLHTSLPQPQATGILFHHRALAKVRGVLPPGLIRLGRQLEDEPVILETWL
jgi:hypothetical protein